MKFLIILIISFNAIFALPSKEIKSRNVIVPAGRPEGRITHGSNANKEQYPYVVALSLTKANGDEHVCGGSILSNEWILTAAHCTEDVVECLVFVGATNLRSAEVIHNITDKDIILHDNYDTFTLENDISLIKIPSTPYSDKVKSVKLPAHDKPYASYVGEHVIATGWGKTSDTGPGFIEDLQWARLTIIPDKLCGKSFELFSSNMCTATKGGVNICNGDSGGPLVMESSNLLVGITSYTAEQCTISTPAVYTRITNFLPWIKQKTGISY